MAPTPKRVHKHFQLDAAKIKRAQRVLRAKTETEAIDLALDFAISEMEKQRLTIEATERLGKSGIHITDAYNVMGD